MKYRCFTLLFIVVSFALAQQLCPNGHLRRAIRFSEPHARLGYAPVFWIYLVSRSVSDAYGESWRGATQIALGSSGPNQARVCDDGSRAGHSHGFASLARLLRQEFSRPDGNASCPRGGSTGGRGSSCPPNSGRQRELFSFSRQLRCCLHKRQSGACDLSRWSDQG